MRSIRRVSWVTALVFASAGCNVAFGFNPGEAEPARSNDSGDESGSNGSADTSAEQSDTGSASETLPVDDTIPDADASTDPDSDVAEEPVEPDPETGAPDADTGYADADTGAPDVDTGYVDADTGTPDADTSGVPETSTDTGPDADADSEAPVVSSVAVTPASPSLLTGAKQSLVAKATYSSGTISDVTSKCVWSSSSPSVASVSNLATSAGEVTAVSAGTTVVSCAYSGKTGSTTVNVSAPPPVLTLTGDGVFGSVPLGGTASRTFTLKNTGGPSGALAANAGSPFNVGTTTCAGGLAAGATCQVVVHFDPTILGARAGTLSVGSASIALSGTGFAHFAVTKAGTALAGASSVTGGGIDCGGTCAADMTGPLTLTAATTDPTAVFTGWGAPCSPPSSSSCAITDPSKTSSVTAYFDRRYKFQVLKNTCYSAYCFSSDPLSVTLSSGGTTLASCDDATITSGKCVVYVAYGTNVTVNTTVGDGGSTYNWSGSACSGSSTSSCNANVTGDVYTSIYFSW